MYGQTQVATQSNFALDVLSVILWAAIIIYFAYHITVLSRRSRIIADLLEARNRSDGLFLFPNELTCPFCKTEWELAEQERLRPIFKCTKCETKVRPRDLQESGDDSENAEITSREQ